MVFTADRYALLMFDSRMGHGFSRRPGVSGLKRVGDSLSRGFGMIVALSCASFTGCENNQTMQRIRAVNESVENVNEHAEEIHDAAQP